MQLILITGLSGSGKSIALNVLEDAGIFAVDNLPASLLPQLLTQLRAENHDRVAVAMDMRYGSTATTLPQQLATISADPSIELSVIFLDSSDEVLIQRFSETRRKHPLATDDSTLIEAIHHERIALEKILSIGHRIDTSNLRPNALRAFIKEFVQPNAKSGLTLLFESFGFKYGLPMDADLVFDVRCLPNPHYDPKLRSLTGKDKEVIAFLDANADTAAMIEDIAGFIERWLPSYINDNRSYLTVAIGCTGGWHRSVYFVEKLAARFRDHLRVLSRHRNLQ